MEKKSSAHMDENHFWRKKHIRRNMGKGSDCNPEYREEPYKKQIKNCRIVNIWLNRKITCDMITENGRV